MSDESVRTSAAAWDALRTGIMEWWDPSDHEFPWRSGQDEEWKLLVTEVLLQRTRAEAVAKIYPTFFRRFDTPGRLALATVEEIREVIYPLGLPWRAKFLKELGQYLLDSEGRVPATRAELEALPGVGPYVAAAFLTLHRAESEAFIDANIVRLLGRYFGFDWDGETRRRRWFVALVQELFEHMESPDRFGYAVLDFTREVCSRAPAHDRCPACIRQHCAMYRAAIDGP